MRWLAKAETDIGELADMGLTNRFFLQQQSKGTFVDGAMVLAVVVGAPASYALVRYRFPGKLFVEQLISLSLVFPAAVMGTALLMMTSRIPGDMGFAGIVTAHVIITFPFVVRIAPRRFAA